MHTLQTKEPLLNTSLRLYIISYILCTKPKLKVIKVKKKNLEIGANFLFLVQTRFSILVSFCIESHTIAWRHSRGMLHMRTRNLNAPAWDAFQGGPAQDRDNIKTGTTPSQPHTPVPLTRGDLGRVRKKTTGELLRFINSSTRSDQTPDRCQTFFECHPSRRHPNRFQRALTSHNPRCN